MARKRLHNEMEDLKGKIRVYVRIRPISRSELERGCQEAALKVNIICTVIDVAADAIMWHYRMASSLY